MDITTNITVPDYIYKFYKHASAHVSNSSASKLMSDALAAYAALLSDEVAKAGAFLEPDSIEEHHL